MFRPKPRKDSSLKGIFTVDGKTWVIGADLLRNSDVEEAKRVTRARACFKECRTCGACANSARDATYPYTYDDHERKNINCIGCEPFRYHDCHNGWMRDSYGDAEPFTPDVIKLLKESGGKPLI